MQNKIIVAGIGPGGEDFITPAALKKIRAAKFLVGGRRALNDFTRDGQITCPITRDLDTAINFIRDKLNLGDVVVIVSGDPGYYSMLDTLRKNFPPPTIEVIPSISAIQLAFAKLSLPWHGATLLSFHGRQPARAALQFTAGKVLGLLTDAENNSATISRLLINCGWASDSLITICDRLSYPDEKIFTMTLAEAAVAEPVKHCVLIVQGAEIFTGATQNLVDANVNRLLEIFPTCATEIQGSDGKFHAAVNFDVLRQILDTRLVEGKEAYTFDFVGKKRAALEAHAPIRKTLRPLRDKSRDFDTTANLYIEGDNLDALKILQESYCGKVKLIYIDPPYNTGNDFVYRDDFKHSDWCAMIYSRLLIAKNFLSNDGAIFISIDDHEQANLKKICDEVFGEKNFVANIVWKRKAYGNNMGIMPPVHDFILVYCKDINNLKPFVLPQSEEYIKNKYSNPDGDPRGDWTTMSLTASHKGPHFAITNPNTGEKFFPPRGRYWVFNEAEVLRRIADGRIIFGKSGKSSPVQKVFAAERNLTDKAHTWFDRQGYNGDATNELMKIFGQKIFISPKPTSLIKHILKLATDKDSIVMDFFSGSATTAHAVLELNAQDGGNRRFIMIQLDEATPENSEARCAGYKTICDIGEERIRRIGDKLKAAFPELDAGFRVFKVDIKDCDASTE